MSFAFWYMLPTAIAIATVAMASGVGGATFFAPLIRRSPRNSIH